MIVGNKGLLNWSPIFLENKMKETQKCYQYMVDNEIFDRYLNGRGLDICSPIDDLLITSGLNDDISHYTEPKEHALHLNTIQDSCFEFVYASHILPEMEIPSIAFRNWIRVCRPGGFLYVVVPEPDKYYQGQWPCPWNAAHRWNFSNELPSGLDDNIVIVDFLQQFLESVEVVDIVENVQNWDETIPRGVGPITRPYREDQTYDPLDNTILNIEIILRKL